MKKYSRIFLIICLGIGCLWFVSFHKIHTIDGTSMQATLHAQDSVIVDKKAEITRYEPIAFSVKNEKGMLVKRVIGMPKDAVIVQGNELILSTGDHPAFKNTYRLQLSPQQAKALQTMTMIPENHYFVLGDNIDVSKDSRTFGLVEKKAVEGVLTYRIWPLRSFGRVN